MNLCALIVAGCLLPAGTAWASGCFGGDPDVVPRSGASGIPPNSQVKITRRAGSSVEWSGPDGRAVSFRERRMGKGPSAARVLTPAERLRAGRHTVRLKDPDLSYTFLVGGSADSTPPRLSGPLKLEGMHAPEPSSECPENTYIRATFPAPADDRTRPEDHSYLVWFSGGYDADLLVTAESIRGGNVAFRFGETGCGCIPRARLTPGATYRVRVQAVDLAGHASAESLAGEVTIPSRQ